MLATFGLTAIAKLLLDLREEGDRSFWDFNNDDKTKQ